MKTFPALASACLLLCAFNMLAENYKVYIGTYTGQKSQGIYMADFESESGELSAVKLAAATPSPSFLAIHPSKPFLYAVGEGASVGPKKEGTVTAFAISQGSGLLKKLNQQLSGGNGPCHVSLDAEGKCVMAANYGSGSVIAFPVGADGGLGTAGSVIQHEGSSIDPKRQSSPHAHHIVADLAGTRAYCCDLGLDKVMIYRVLGEARLEKNDPPFASVQPGAGPRHLSFHPNGKHAYVINEMSSTITAFHVESPTGALRAFQEASTLPPDFNGDSSCAEIEVHPSGRFLYASNRGHNSVAVFSIAESGELVPIQHAASGGQTPRFFAVDPTGRWLLAANQDSDNIMVFRLSGSTGMLTATGRSIEVGKPVCLAFRKR